MGYLGGFKVTFGKIFHKTDSGKVVTLEYLGGQGGDTDLKREKPERMHGRHVLNR